MRSPLLLGAIAALLPDSARCLVMLFRMGYPTTQAALLSPRRSAEEVVVRAQ